MIPEMSGAPLKATETLALPTPFASPVTVISTLPLLARFRMSVTVRVMVQVPTICGAVHVAVDNEG